MRKLHSTNDILDAIAAKHGGASDYRLGKLLGTAGQSAVNRWRRGAASLSPEFAVRAAELLGWPEAYVMACVESERLERSAAAARAAGRDPLEETGKIARTWRAIAEQFRPLAGVLLLALLGAATADRVSAGTLSVSGPCGSPVYTLCATGDEPQGRKRRRRKRSGPPSRPPRFATWLPICDLGPLAA